MLKSSLTALSREQLKLAKASVNGRSASPSTAATSTPCDRR